MLRDRSEPVDLFMLVPALELRFEPELAELDRLLDDDQIFRQVKADLSRRRPHTTQTGRPSTPVEVTLRLRSCSTCTTGVTRRPSTSSATAWCCASSADWGWTPYRTTPR